MVNCLPPAAGVPENCKGGLPKFVWDYMFREGVLAESCQCYSSHDGQVKQCMHQSCTAAGQPELTKPETREVYHMRNINALVYAIEYMGPLMAGISISSENVQALNKFNEGIQGKVKYDMQSLFGRIAQAGKHAGHAIVIVGYRVRDFLLFIFIFQKN